MKLIILFLCGFLVVGLPAGPPVAANGVPRADQEILPEMSPEVSPALLLTLDDCVDIVLGKSPALASAEADLGEKAAVLDSARKDLYPTLSFQYNYLRQPDSSFQFNGFSLNVEDYYSYSLTVEQPLYRGRALVTAVKKGELDYRSAQAAYTVAWRERIFAVHQAYFDLLRAEKLAEEAAQALVRLESQSRDAQAFHEAGLIPKNDLLASELETAQGRQNLLQARNAVQLAEAALNILLRRPVAAPVAVVDILTYEPRQVDWREVKELALNSRPEVERAALAIQLAENDIVLSRAPFLPSLTLSATYKRQGDAPLANDYPLGSSEIRSAQAVAQWRFWSWGQKNNEVAAANQRLRKNKEAAAQVVDGILLELRGAFLELKVAEENIGVTAKAIAQAEENYRINKARYQVQLNTSTDVLDAQSLLTRAKTNYYNALYAYNMAKVNLDRASGSLGQ